MLNPSQESWDLEFVDDRGTQSNKPNALERSVLIVAMQSLCTSGDWGVRCLKSCLGVAYKNENSVLHSDKS